jgi:hypothetical protein
VHCSARRPGRLDAKVLNKNIKTMAALPLCANLLIDPDVLDAEVHDVVSRFTSTIESTPVILHFFPPSSTIVTFCAAMAPRNAATNGRWEGLALCRTPSCSSLKSPFCSYASPFYK